MTPAEACAVKVRFRKRADAESAATRFARHGLNRGRKLWPYRCPICERWHLTKGRDT